VTGLRADRWSRTTRVTFGPMLMRHLTLWVGRRSVPPKLCGWWMIETSFELFATSRGSTRENVIFSNSLWTNSEYPNLLKIMFMVPVNFRWKKMTPSSPTNPPKSRFFVLVTGLVTQLASPVNDPVLALILSNSMYLRRELIM